MFFLKRKKKTEVMMLDPDVVECPISRNWLDEWSDDDDDEWDDDDDDD